MNVGRYRLLAQLEAARDGVSYRAQVNEGGFVEVRVLTGARADVSRWQLLARRLRLVLMLEHPGALKVRELALEHDPPFVALEWVGEKTLGDELSSRVPLPGTEVVALAHGLAEVMAAGCRLGLAHGRLCPSVIHVTPEQRLKIDFTRIELRSAPGSQSLAELDAFCRAPEPERDGMPAYAADIYSLGALFFWLLTGQGPRPDRNGHASRLLPQAALSEIRRRVPAAAHSLELLLDAMLASEPAERPPARDVEVSLTKILDRLVQSAPSEPQATIDSGVATPVTFPVPTPVEDKFGERLGRIRRPDELGEQSPPVPDARLSRENLGRYRLLEKLGQGGMGAVYRAQDPVDGAIVAIKTLRSDLAHNPQALLRLHKESRLLAEVNNPHVTNLLEVNEDDGIHYLVLEFVAGRHLGALLAERGRLDEPVALAILADVARALVDAHERGIVHRDIKPDNILLDSGLDSAATQEFSIASRGPTSEQFKVKLSDFGLARHVVESESLNVTQAGALVGTPFYMAPEQCSGGATDPRTDIYAMGVTLFQMLSGRLPFESSTPMAVITMHCNDPPPALGKLNPALSDGVVQLVEKALAKAPEARYPNAGALLRDLECLLRGEPVPITVHPQLPTCDPRKVITYEWSWELEASPQELWPHVSNTDRLNRAVGLPAIQFTTQVLPLTLPSPPEGGGEGSDVRAEDSRRGTRPPPRVKRMGRIQKLGLTVTWEEHPFEWIEGQRLGVLREFSHGPFKWLVSRTELTPRARRGTLLRHKVWVEPRGLLGRTVAAVEIGVKGRRHLDRVYRRIDATVTGRLGSKALVDPFEEDNRLSTARRERLERLLDRLVACGVAPAVVERLGDFVAQAPSQEVTRIRPLALARRLDLDGDQVVAACLHGVREGLLLLLWDILCPVCRIASDIKETLQAVRAHGRCEACNLDFELDFANSVELVFQAHPEIRATEQKTYCVGGPAHSPHVVVQVRVGAGERLEVNLMLAEGAYRLRGPQLPYALDFRVQPSVPASHWDLNLCGGVPAEWPRVLRSGGQVLVLTNDSSQELVVRVERTVSREDALSAARAASLALFRDLFPGEMLSPGQLVRVATVTLLTTALDQAGRLYQDLGDAKAFALFREHFLLLDQCIRREGGAVVKTVGEGVLAAFSESAAAVRAALSLQALRAGEATRGLQVRVSIHRGPAMAATLNGQLDYFGSTVNLATQLPQLARGGEVILSQAVAADPEVAALLRGRGLQGEPLQVDLPGQPRGMALRLAGLFNLHD